MTSTTSRSNVGETSPPPARNEPVRDYAPGSPERTELAATLARMAGDQIELPMIVGGREVRTGALQDVVSPHDHRGVLAKAHVGGRPEIEAAVAAAAALGPPGRGHPGRSGPRCSCAPPTSWPDLAAPS